MFGLEKEVTMSDSNVLFEINGKNALDIYKHYLGPEAAGLPGSALLFPLAAKLPGENEPIVRTILSIDESAGSMTFAGDIPVGSLVRFMKANFIVAVAQNQKGIVMIFKVNSLGKDGLRSAEQQNKRSNKP